MRPSDKTAGRSSQVDQRGSERRPFTATAVVTDADSNTRLSGRVSDLGRGGCYVDLLNAVPIGTTVHVLIRHANQCFEARGVVSYVLERMGMGIAFTEVSNSNARLLEEWLGLNESGESRSNDVSHKRAPSRGSISQRLVLTRLINLLAKQRAITPEQAAELLNDLTFEVDES